MVCMTRSRIVGLGRAVPERVVANHQLEQALDVSDDWITSRTGIRQRHIASDLQTTSELALEAGRAACSNAGVDPQQLDAIIVGTVTPDMAMPATAPLVQHGLGAGNCPAFDVSAACAGFIYALATADGMIRTGRQQRVLVIGVDLLSRFLDWQDRDTCVLFGDAAGAALLVAEQQQQGILDIDLGSDGAGAGDLRIRHQEAARVPDGVGGRRVLEMNGRAVFTQAVRRMSHSCSTLLERNTLDAADVDRVFAHQANLRILEAVSGRTRIPMERFQINIQRYGNTSAASIPLVMSEALEQGQLHQGELLLLTALGAGISWGSALVRW